MAMVAVITSFFIVVIAMAFVAAITAVVVMVFQKMRRR